ncbi:MAG: hypothetical protein V1753_02495, partial [Pseudomonadota bacterium]
VVLGFFVVFFVLFLSYSLFSSSLKSTVRKLSGILEELRAIAVRENKEYQLHIDVDSETYWITTFGMSEEEAAKVNRVRLPQGVEFVDVQTRDDKVAVAGVSIRFSPQAYADEAIIHIKDDSDKVFTLSVGTFLPMVKVDEEYIEFKS